MMKICVVVAALVLVAAAADNRAAFEAFKAKYGKTYATPEEEQRRLTVFGDNLEKAKKFQATNPLATFGVNLFSDLSEEEFKVYHSAQKALNKRAAKATKFADRLPEEVRASTAQSIDWRQKGAVTPVKNQGQCGSCWSFSTTGSIEGQWFLAGNPLVSLSEQELVSCDDIDDGCNGGFQDDAFEWLFFSGQRGQIFTDASYPYVSGTGNVPKCDMSKGVVGAQITGYQDIARSEEVMKEQVSAKGPLAISLDATSFQSYTGGILTNCISQEIDHAVLIVGYDMSAETPYWIVKNSWTAQWGEEGYIRIAYGSNQCLISAMPTTAVVNGSAPIPPAPVTPAPPTPVTPTPQWTPAPQMPTPAPQAPTPSPASGKTFQQKVCQNSACTEGCRTDTLPQGQCLKAGATSSAIATCTPKGLEVKQYIFAADCTGFAMTSVEPVNQCGADNSGTYVENICPTSKATFQMFTSGSSITLSKAAQDAAKNVRKF